MKQYYVIGVMSGTSLDGIDVAYSKYFFENDKWNFKLIAAETYSFNFKILSLIEETIKNKPKSYKAADIKLGMYYAKIINQFINEHNIIEIDFVANHGQTVYHKPAEKITIQLGDGATIAEITQLTCINNFRNLDVAIGGQGAPLVPIGDFHFYNKYNYCINLGGISNITVQNKNEVVLAYDVSPCNVLLNHYTRQTGFEFDRDGKIGRSGLFNKPLFNKLNENLYYKKQAPKSLDAQDCINVFVPIIDEFDILVEDKLNTIYFHITHQIKTDILKHHKNKNEKVLLSGGGALNKFLVETIQHALPIEVFVPATEIIEYKEAIIFGLLGVLKMNNSVNCLKVVTGAVKDNVGGQIWKPKPQKKD